MRLFKKIADAFRSSKPKHQAASPACKQPAQADIEEIMREMDYDLGFLMSRLNHPGKNLQDRAEKREEAMRRLQELGPEAEKAIPELIEKLFSEEAWERQMASETLESIDAQWHNSPYTHHKIPFLIKKLGKRHLAVNRATTVLSKIGPPAAPHLEDVLQPGAPQDDLLKANALRAWSKINSAADGIPAAIREILKTAEAIFLLEAAAEVVGKLDRTDAIDQSLLYPLLEHEDAVLRQKAVKALSNYPAIEEGVLPHLFKCLAEEREELRKEAVALLQQHDSEFADAFYREVIFEQGELKEEDIVGAFEKLSFIFSKSTLEEFRLRKEKFIDNLSWYNFELQQEMEKPKRLLQSVLEVLKAKSPPDPELAEGILLCFEKHQKAGIQKACVELLAKSKQAGETVVPLLIKHLNQPSDQVRSAIINALDELDPDWMNRPAANEFIGKLVNQLDTSGTAQEAKEQLLSLGDNAAPMLVTHLEQSDKRITQQTIIDILDKLGSSAEIDLNTLLKIKERCTNTHTVNALHELVERLRVELD